MSRRRSTPVKLLIAVAASVFLLGIIAAELPELWELSDNTSNDFAMRRAGSTEFTSILSTENQKLLPLNTMGPDNGTEIRRALIFEDSKPASSGSFFLDSVLRT